MERAQVRSSLYIVDRRFSVKEKWKLTVCVISVLTVLTAVLLIIARIFFGYDVFDRSCWVTAEYTPISEL